MEQADRVQSDKFASSGTPSNEFRLSTVTFLFKFQANKMLSEPLITLRVTTIQYYYRTAKIQFLFFYIFSI